MSTTNRLTIRARSPTASELKALRSTIRAVAPKAEKQARDTAMHELQEAIYDFRLHYPYKSSNRKERGKVAEKRDALSDLAATLRTTALAVKELPLDAKKVFSRGAGTPIGKIISLLDGWSAIASTKYRVAKKEGDRPADDAPSLLAFCVARTLSRTLQSRVSMTSDRNTAGYARNGAGYCRLLRSTLQAAGADPPIDLIPIMKEGKILWQGFLSERRE
jgi:hypothetical protein